MFAEATCTICGGEIYKITEFVGWAHYNGQRDHAATDLPIDEVFAVPAKPPEAKKPTKPKQEKTKTPAEPKSNGKRPIENQPHRSADEIQTITPRISKKLHARLTRAAALSNRSMNKLIVDAVEHEIELIERLILRSAK